MKKWLDRKINEYQEHASEKFEEMQKAHLENPAAFQPQALNVVQGAQGNYNPAAAEVLSSPETAQFLGESQPEQMRQMQELQAYGTRMKALWETGVDAVLTILSLEPTGATLGGQQQFAIRVRVDGHAGTTEAVCVQTIPDPMLDTYAVGARFEGKVDKADVANVGIFRGLD